MNQQTICLATNIASQRAESSRVVIERLTETRNQFRINNKRCAAHELSERGKCLNEFLSRKFVKNR